MISLLAPGKLILAARLAVPTLFTVLLMAAAGLPYGVPHLPPLGMGVTLVCVFYWTIYRPELMPAGATFLIGLFYDMLSGAPLGLNALLLVLVHGVLISQRRAFIGKPFLPSWLGFAVIAAGASTVAWLAISLFYLRFLSPGPAIMEILATVSLYPLLVLLLGWTQRRFVGQI